MKLAYIALIVLLGYGYVDASWTWTGAGMPNSAYPSVKVKSVGASNQFGIWITTDKNEVYLRKSESGPWYRAVQDRARARYLALTYVSVGQHQAWGVGPKGEIYTTSIKSHVAPWRRQRGPPLKQISVSDRGNVMGIHTDGSVWLRNRGQWRRGAHPNMKVQSLSVGWAGIWAVGVRGVVWYRPGSYGGSKAGGNWQRLSDKAMVQVHSGEDFVVGVDANRDVYRREVSDSNNAGTSWVLMNDEMKMKASYVTSGRYKVFGINDGRLVKTGALQH